MHNDLITITINGKSHQFKVGDVEAMRALPWPERKQLIELLENIKQAEYVQTNKPNEPLTDAGFKSNIEIESKQPSIPDVAQVNPILKAPKNEANNLDPAIKASDSDVDDLMARLIMEQKNNNHKSVPDKSSVIKLLLIVFAIIVVLALIF